MSTQLDQAAAYARHLVEPRGRCDRRAMFSVTVALLIAQFVMALVYGLAGGDLQSPFFLLLNLPLMWIGVVVILKRLHDIGWSGWWIVPAVAFWIVGTGALIVGLTLAIGPARFDALLAAYPLLDLALHAVSALPPLGGLLWMQACPGQTSGNRFGPVPGTHGFAAGHAKAPTSDMLDDGALPAA